MHQSDPSAPLSQSAATDALAQPIGRRRFLQALGATAVGLLWQPSSLLAAEPIALAFAGATDHQAVRAVLAVLDGRPATFFVTAAALREQTDAGQALWAMVQQAGHEPAFQATPHYTTAAYRAELRAWRAAWPRALAPLPSPLCARAAAAPCHALAAACTGEDVLLTAWPPLHLPTWTAVQQQTVVLLPLAPSGSPAEAALLTLLHRFSAESRPTLTVSAYCARHRHTVEPWSV